MSNNQNVASGYNLEEEKLFVEEVHRLIKEEIRKDRMQELQHSPLFSQKVASIPETMRTFLLSFDRVHFYNEIAKKHNLSQEQRNKLPHCVWESALKDDWGNLSQYIFSGVSLPQESCEQIAQDFLQSMQDFLQIQKTQEKESPVQQSQKNNRGRTSSLSLKKALEKYPRIMQARVTDADIVFRGSDGDVVPSVKNWITAYHQEMGSRSHEPFERSQFLFHNKNALALSQRERNILSEILRSLDEETELPINMETQSIDLDALQKSASNEKMSSSEEQETFSHPALEPSHQWSVKKQWENEDVNDVPPAEGSLRKLYTKELIDNRKDVWRNAPSQQKKLSSQEVPSSEGVASFARGLSFTPHVQGEEIVTDFIEKKRLPVASESVNANLNNASNESQTTFTRRDQVVTEKPSFSQDFRDQGGGLQKQSFQRERSQKPHFRENDFQDAPYPSLTNRVSQGDILRTPSLDKRVQVQTQEQGQKTPLRTPSGQGFQTNQIDYTDYYPIPKEPKVPKQNIQENLSFSSPHVFPVEQSISETQKKRVFSQNTPQNTPQAFQQVQKNRTSLGVTSQDEDDFSAQKMQANTPKSKRRMIIG